MANPKEQVVRALRSLASDAPVKLRVAGECMSPLAASGALLLIARKKRYWPGDVIAFRAASGSLLLHRLIGFRPRGGAFDLVTQGDGCSTHDAPVRGEQVIGKVCGGDCAPELARVPFRHRLKAVVRFAGVVRRRLCVALHVLHVPNRLDNSR